MLKNYFLVTLRNLRNNKLFSLINIAGLAIGLSTCFLIWQYVQFESSYDAFHENAKSLYRVTLQITENGVPVRGMASNHAGVGHALEDDFSEVKASCRLVQTSLFTSDLGRYYANALEFSYQRSSGNFVAFNEERVWFADAPILSMFSFPLIAGTKDALREPNSVVITESISKKYFGDDTALGQTLRLNRDLMLKVTGVIKDVPVNSHLQFDILISFATMRPRLGDMYDNWSWNAFYTYILLHEDANATVLQSKLPAFKDLHIGIEKGPVKTAYELQPITDIHLKSQLESEQSPTSNEQTVYFLSILAIFILIVAWINYINLSTAKALERSKEVGLRKAVGATRRQLIYQFLFDTALINLLAFLLAVVLVIALWSTFESLVGKQLETIYYVGVRNWFIAGLVFISGVIISGIYPALTLSSFNPSKVLKGKFFKTASGTSLRKLMISFQYVLAVLLIAGTLTIYLQLSHMRSMDTGFTKDQIVVIEAPAVYDSSAGQKIAFFKTSVLQLPGVKNITATSDVPGRPIVEGSPIGPITAKQNSDYFRCDIPSIDSSFFSTFDISIIEGRLFEPEERMDFRLKQEDEAIPVLVNEEFARRMNAKDHAEILNEKMTFWWGPDQRYAKIIGVVTNHHQVSFKNRIEPIMYMQPAWQASKYFAVRVQGNLTATIASIKDLYKQTFADHPYTWFFLDEHFDNQYRDEQQFGKIINVFTILAMIVTCLGLLGLSVFSVTQRTKEVGIRKVLGASAFKILFLFSKDFLRVLFIAYIIAVPVIYWASNNWLDNFTFRIPLPWQIFTLPLLLLIVITLATIVTVTTKAILDNPVRALRENN